MANVVKLKYLKCIEWTLETPPRSGLTYCSEVFYFLNRKCHLHFSLEFRDMVTYSYLYFKVNEKFQPPPKVTVFVSSNSGVLPVESHTLTNSFQNIWRNTKLNLLGRILSFQVIVQNDNSDDAILGCEYPEQIQMSPDKAVYLEALSRDISKLLNESSSCDITITCDETTFNAHRNVLEARSPVLSAMLNSDMVEGKSGSVKVGDVEASIFQGFLGYLYSGILPELDVDNANKFYEVADKYAVEELKIACSVFLTNNLTESNACEMLVLADQHSDEVFRKNVIYYMIKKKIPEDDSSWFDFCKVYPVLANEVLNLYVRKNRMN